MQNSQSYILLFGTLVVALLAALTGQAQQMPQYSQYIFNSLLINPAYTGSKNFLNAHAMYRSQWAGLEGAPATATISLDGINQSERIGWGVYLMQDRIGAETASTLSGSTAVKLKTSGTGVFSLGLAGGISYYAFNQNKIKTGTPNDPVFINGSQQVITPDLKAGVYYHTQKFYAGLSGANLLLLSSSRLVQPRPHLYFTSGYVFTLNTFLKLKPSFLVKDDFKARTSADLNVFLLLDEKFWLGTSYRRQLNIWQSNTENFDFYPIAAMAYMAEFYLTDKMRIGYAYDATKSGLNNYGSHEISMGFNFISKPRTRTVSPRYF